MNYGTSFEVGISSFLQIIQLGTDIGMMAKVGHLWDGKMDCISNGSTMDPDALMKKSGTLIHEGVSQHFVIRETGKGPSNSPNGICVI